MTLVHWMHVYLAHLGSSDGLDSDGLREVSVCAWPPTRLPGSRLGAIFVDG